MGANPPKTPREGVVLPPKGATIDEGSQTFLLALLGSPSGASSGRRARRGHRESLAPIGAPSGGPGRGRTAVAGLTSSSCVPNPSCVPTSGGWQAWADTGIPVPALPTPFFLADMEGTHEEETRLSTAVRSPLRAKRVFRVSPWSGSSSGVRRSPSRLPLAGSLGVSPADRGGAIPLSSKRTARFRRPNLGAGLSADTAAGGAPQRQSAVRQSADAGSGAPRPGRSRARS
jgi:hypothetical protein